MTLVSDISALEISIFSIDPSGQVRSTSLKNGLVDEVFRASAVTWSQSSQYQNLAVDHACQ
jgi:hypothetical protein